MSPNNKRKKVAQKMRTGMKASSNDIRQKVMSNPYEVRKNKTVHANVIGRVIKGNNRNVLLSNEKSLTQRQKSIGDDYEKTNKKNIFKDRRFGAADTVQAMTEEEKMLKKLEIQRKKQLKRQKFALADENDEEELTHGGKSLDIADDFKRLHEDIDDDEEDPAMDPELFIRTNLNKQGEEDRDRPKTQKEIMMEIIEKSKAYREERRKEAESVSNEIESVDAMMDDLHSLLSFKSDDHSKKTAIPQSKSDEDYDRLTAQLAQEAKGKASDRQKTQEELDQEEKERLEKLEKERESRMQGIVTEESRMTGDIQDESIIKKKSDEDIVLDAIEEEGKMTVEEEKDYDEDYELLFGKKREEEEEHAVNVKPKKETRQERIKAIQKEKEERAAIMEQAKHEIPYVIEIPRGLSELCGLLNEYVDVDDSVHLILARIVKSNNPNVRKDAKNDFVNFYRNVINLVEAYATQNCLTSYILQCIQGCLFVMQIYIPQNTVTIWLDMISRIKARVLTTKVFPRFSDIVLLHLALNLFSNSDFQHNIVNSAVLLLSHIMLECTITTTSQLCSALYLMSVIVDYCKASKRYVPELYKLLIACSRYLLINDAYAFKEKQAIVLDFQKKGKTEQNIDIAECCSSSPSVTKPQLQFAILKLIKEVFLLNEANPAGYIYCLPLCDILNQMMNLKQLDPIVKAELKEISESGVMVMNAIINQRKHIPLQAEVLKPKFISFAPSYEDNFTPGMMLHPNKEHVKQRELRKQVKREKRGVEREMRREAEVIQNMRDEEKREIDEQQTAKLKQVMSWLEEDQANYNRAVKKGVVTGGGSKIQNNLK